MQGISASTGKSIAGLDHLRQSLRDILSTRKGTRVMRRAYGSDLPALVDAPLNDDTLVDLYAATAEAIAIWEPRIDLHQVTVQEAGLGRVVLQLEGIYVPTGDPIVVDGLEVT